MAEFKFWFVYMLISSTCILKSNSFETLILSQKLTPANVNNIDDINIITNEVTTNAQNEWNATITSESKYQFIIYLDKTWGFHPDSLSSIKLTINSPSISTPETFDDIVFGFTTNNKEYFSIWIPMDNVGQKNRIYPNCDTSSTPTQTFGIGDIASLLNTDRVCDIAGGSCNNWRTMHPKNAQMPTVYQYNGFPITLTLENDPISNTFYVYFDTALFEDQFVQKCGFVALPNDEGLQIYIGGNDPGHTFIISSFLIESYSNATDPGITTNIQSSNSSNSSNSTNSTEIILMDDDEQIDAKIDKKKDGVNLELVVGIIVGMFVFVIVAVILYIKCSSNKANDNINKDEMVIDVDNDMAAPEATEATEGDKYDGMEQEGLNEGYDESEITGNDVRWHNLNSSLVIEHHDGVLNVTGDDEEPLKPSYQYQ